MKRFNYSVSDIPADECDWHSVERFLRDMGADGWELVSYTPAIDGGARIILKQELPP